MRLYAGQEDEGTPSAAKETHAAATESASGISRLEMWYSSELGPVAVSSWKTKGISLEWCARRLWGETQEMRWPREETQTLGGCGEKHKY